MSKPEVQFIAVTRKDGGLSIAQMAIKSAITEREATDENINAFLKGAGVEYVSWRRIKPEEVPVDRAFRDAWIDTGNKVTVDPSKMTPK